MVRTGRPGDRGRGAEGLAAQGAVATEEERGDKSIRLPRMEREREGHLPRLPSNQRQKTKKTRIIQTTIIVPLTHSLIIILEYNLSLFL